MGSLFSLGRICGDVMMSCDWYIGKLWPLAKGKERHVTDSSVSSSSVCMLTDGVCLLRP